MPLKFDTGKYASNWNPITKGSFVQTQNVMDDVNGIWEQVWQAILNYLKDTASNQDVENIISQAITQLLDNLFPSTSGSTSQLITELSNWTGVDFNTLAQDFENLFSVDAWNTWLTNDWNTLLSWFGITPANVSTTPPTVQQSWVTNLETDLASLLNISTWTNWLTTEYDQLLAVFGMGSSTSTPTVQQSWVSGLESALSTFLTTGNYNVLLNALFGTTSVQPTIAQAAVPTNIPTTKLNSTLGFTTLYDDLSNLATTLFGGHTVNAQINSSAVPNISAGTGAGQSADLLSWLTATSSAVGTVSNSALDAANKGMGLLANTVQGLSAKVQNSLTGQVGASQSGKSYQVYFGAYPSGDFSAAPFTTTYGPIPGQTSYGTGHLGLANGDAVWNGANNGDVSVVGIYCPAYILTFTGTPTSFTLTYNGQTTSAITYSTATASGIQAALQALSNMPANGVEVSALTSGGYQVRFMPVCCAAFSVTTTGGSGAISNAGYTDNDYQELQASLAGLPSGPGSINFAILRSNAAGTTYVYGAVYLSTSYTLNWILGCVIGGVNHVWDSGSGAPLNFNFTMVAGVGTEPNRYQGISGDTVVFDWTNTSSDDGGLFPVGTAQRYWGFRSDTYNGGRNAPAPAAYVGCADNSPPDTVGSGFRQYSSSGTTSMTHSSGTVLYFPTGFFDTTAEATPDWSFNSLPSFPGVVAATAQNKGWYAFDLRCQMQMASSLAMTSISIGMRRYNSAGALQETILLPGVGVSYNLDTLQGYTSHFGGNGGIYMEAGDSIVPYYWIDGPGPCSSLSFIGDAAGAQTWWAMRLANWSLN
jgi:hypothetical protein